MVNNELQMYLQRYLTLDDRENIGFQITIFIQINCYESVFELKRYICRQFITGNALVICRYFTGK